WSLAVVGLVYAQTLLGALVRHTRLPLGPRGHLLGAFVVVAAVGWLAKLVYDRQPRDRQFTGPGLVLGSLVLLRLFLGVEAWLAKFAVPQWTQLRPLLVTPDLLRSLHYLVGALLFATAVVTTLQVHHRTAWAVKADSVPAGRLEGAA